jgi:hypothetical protein
MATGQILGGEIIQNFRGAREGGGGGLEKIVNTVFKIQIFSKKIKKILILLFKKKI